MRGSGAPGVGLELHAARTVGARRRDARLRSPIGASGPCGAAQPRRTKPVKYRIYGKRRKGLLGQRRTVQRCCRSVAEVPRARQANFVTEVSATEIAVIGGEVKLTTRIGPSTGSWRWTTMEAERPSDFAEAPGRSSIRVLSPDAKVDSAYRYRCPPSARSETPTRVVGGQRR